MYVAYISTDHFTIAQEDLLIAFKTRDNNAKEVTRIVTKTGTEIDIPEELVPYMEIKTRIEHPYMVKIRMYENEG